VASPKLPVSSGSMIIEVSTEGFITQGQSSRLLTTLNLLTTSTIGFEKRIVNNLIDLIPSVFHEMFLQLSSEDKQPTAADTTDKKQFIWAQLRPVCYTSPMRQYFSLIDLHNYTSEDFEEDFTNSMNQLNQFYNAKVEQFISSNNYQLNQVYFYHVANQQIMDMHSPNILFSLLNSILTNTLWTTTTNIWSSVILFCIFISCLISGYDIYFLLGSKVIDVYTLFKLKNEKLVFRFVIMTSFATLNVLFK